MPVIWADLKFLRIFFWFTFHSRRSTLPALQVNILSSMDGRPRPGLPSGEDCCKQSDPEQFKLSVGSKVAGRILGVGNPVHAASQTTSASLVQDW